MERADLPWIVQPISSGHVIRDWICALRVMDVPMDDHVYAIFDERVFERGLPSEELVVRISSDVTMITSFLTRTYQGL